MDYSKVLVTGASGMLGASVVRSLRKTFSCCQIYSIVRSSPLPEGVIRITERDLLPGSFDAVLHLASPASPSNHVAIEAVSYANIELTRIVTASVKSGGVNIFFSTGEVYGPQAGLGVTESDVPRPQLVGPRSYYPLSKLLGEAISQSRSDVRSIVFRVFHTFGPGLRENDGRAFSDFLWGAAKEKKITMMSDGSTIRSFLHIEDFCTAVLLTLKNVDVYGTFNLGSSNPISILEFAKKVSQITSAKIEYQESRKSSSPIPKLTPSTRRLEMLGWEQKHNEDEAITDTWNWILHSLRTIY